MKVDTILFISIFTCLISQINSIEYPLNCNSKDICEKCLENEYSVNGDHYCAKCNDKKGYIGVAGTCIKKENFPKELLIPNCLSYSPNLNYCAVCEAKDSKFDVTETSKCDNIKKKLAKKWIILICVVGGCLIIGLILAIVLVKKCGNLNKQKSEQERIIPPPEPEPVPQPQLLPQLQPQLQSQLQPIVDKDTVFYVCEKYHCSKNGCNEKAVIKSDCNCGYLCFNHASSFYSNNNLSKVKERKILRINEQKCNECDSGVIIFVKKAMPCEECNSPDFLEHVEGKEICSECKNNVTKL